MAEYRRQSRAERRQRNKEVPVDRRTITPPELVLSSQESNRTLTVNLENRFIADNSFELKEYLNNVLNPHSIDRVILHIEKVPYMDSTALGILVDIKRNLNELGVEFCLKKPSHQVSWLIEILMLDRVLPVI